MTTLFCVLTALCIAAFAFLFTMVAQVVKDYDKIHHDMQKSIDSAMEDIRSLRNSLADVNGYTGEIRGDLAKLEQVCLDQNSAFMHTVDGYETLTKLNKDFFNDLKDIEKRLDQMGDALEKHICDCGARSDINALKKQVEKLMAAELKSKGYSNAAIGERLGIHESSVRKLLDFLGDAERPEQNEGFDCIADELSYDEEDVYNG